MSAQTDPADLPLIKVVGISAGGKSTLVRALRQRGYQARPVSQEHSNVPTLWEQFDRPRLLLYLDIDLETQRARRPDVTWNKEWLVEERERLAHARDHADLIIDARHQSPEAVLQIALTFLQNKQIRHAPEPLPPIAPTGSALPPKAATNTSVPAPEATTDDPKRRSNRTQRRRQKRAEKRKDKT
ncbi:MAG: hypothetical protein KDE19_07860 [Caldilineaceae bacterium]|nr:hypothetical protein [Caldilineaceae bacterium]